MKSKKNILLWAFGFLGTLLVYPIDTISDELDEKRVPEKVIMILFLTIIIAIIANIIGYVINEREINIIYIVVFNSVFVSLFAFLVAFVYIIALSILKKDALFGDLFFIGTYSLLPAILLNSLVSPLINYFSNMLALYPIVLGVLLSLSILMFSIDKIGNIQDHHQRFKLHICGLSLVIFVVIFVNFEIVNLVF